MERTGTVAARDFTTNQILDDMPLEQERGITIKLHAIQMKYRAKDANEYILNLIDTPGHVDFSYEVSRSLAACEGAILVVDATQGVEAQTIANVYLAIEAGLDIIPVLNKIDLPSAQTMIEQVKQEIVDLTSCAPEDILLASAKANVGIDEILEAVVHRFRPPTGNPDAPLQALIFDSIFDSYRGAVVYVRVFQGTLKERDLVQFFANNERDGVEEVGILKMTRLQTGALYAGDVGYFTANIKDVSKTKVGDTVTHVENSAAEPIAGFRDVKPMVFSGIYPADSADYENLRDALDTLRLNDSSFIYEPETSTALGFGFRCGFLGLLHMEIVQERLEREFNQTIVNTVPNVKYRVLKTNGDIIEVENPAKMPPVGEIDHVEEPFIRAQIITPAEYIGSILKLCMDRRGVYKNTTYITSTRVDLHFELPLAEVVFDFYDKLKSLSRGYASFDYSYIEDQ